MAALLLATSFSHVVAPPARAGIFSLFAANRAEDIADTIEADDALFAIGTADLGGGRVCIVDMEADVDTASCNTPAWGTPNQIVAVGTFIQPIEGPFLRPGIWRLFGEGDCLKLIRDYCVTPAAATSWRT